SEAGAGEFWAASWAEVGVVAARVFVERIHIDVDILEPCKQANCPMANAGRRRRKCDVLAVLTILAVCLWCWCWCFPVTAETPVVSSIKVGAVGIVLSA